MTTLLEYADVCSLFKSILICSLLNGIIEWFQLKETLKII